VVSVFIVTLRVLASNPEKLTAVVPGSASAGGLAAVCPLTDIEPSADGLTGLLPVELLHAETNASPQSRVAARATATRVFNKWVIKASRKG
jgi:hypothetical protein